MNSSSRPGDRSAGRRVPGVVSLLGALLIGAPAAAQVDALARVFDDGAGNTMPYRLFVPPDLEPQRRYPLVLFLHGAGERGTDNETQIRFHIPNLIEATRSARFASFLLAPQVPVGDSWISPLSVDLVDGILGEVEREHPIDRRRVYLTGLSMGGFGAFRLMFLFPERFAAAVPMSGGAQGNPRAVAAVIKDIPTWVFHGARDTVVPVTNSRVIVQELRDAGGTPRYTEFPTLGHNIWSLAYADLEDQLYPWLFRQSLPPFFSRGDANGDDRVDITDAIFILGFLFTGGPAPGCRKSADADDSGAVDITDGIHVLGHLFLGGAPPEEPFPDCGVDPTGDGLSCESFPPCP